jgi:hypothetical protein
VARPASCGFWDCTLRRDDETNLLRNSEPMTPALGHSPVESAHRFRLSKWYADCVTAQGDVLIAYYGIARWRGLRFHYSSLLQLMGNSRSRAKYSVARSTAPSFNQNTLSWKSRALKFEGTWKSLDPGHSERLFSSNEGFVEWHCLQPRARAQIRGDSKVVFEGLGYAERLEMTIVPWKLPLEYLNWGRFLGDDDSVVWIDWQGSAAKRVMLHNGKTVNEGEVKGDGVSFDADGRLTFAKGTILREGKLGSVALAAIPRVRKLVPRQILEVREAKWRRRAHLSVNGRTSNGWAIHEIVSWPK